ncbi:hypothetical protein DRP53_08375 [candidate division WOR-3 bacterium]|uniref:Uncharacterized protein n=1 Tax=candidate division WOR-3 bacterium TaxID=2052148 RepID=A0A660SEZ3_UNCW3|nr:MAG: hypothetical protein DRP53_08375 [candidate division WOR-3 bacterium]
MSRFLLVLLVLTACTKKEVGLKVKSFYLSYLGNWQEIENLNYLQTASGYKIAYIPIGVALLLNQSGFSFSPLDLVISEQPISGVRTISPYGGYLIKRVGKARIGIWARFEPPFKRDSINFLYLKQKPMLEMRSDFLITIGDSGVMITKDSPPALYRFDLAGRTLHQSEKLKLSPPSESDPSIARIDSLMELTLFRVDSRSALIETLQMRIGCDSLIIPHHLLPESLAGGITFKNLGHLTNLSVQIDSTQGLAILGFQGQPLMRYLFR